MSEFYLIEEKYQRTLDTTIKNPFLHILDSRNGNKKICPHLFHSITH